MGRLRARIREVLREARADERGLVTVEWVGLVAAVFVAAVLIAWFVMEASDGMAGRHAARGGEVDTALDTALERGLEGLENFG
jgi:hypothetical protein